MLGRAVQRLNDLFVFQSVHLGADAAGLLWRGDRDLTLDQLDEPAPEQTRFDGQAVPADGFGVARQNVCEHGADR